MHKLIMVAGTTLLLVLFGMENSAHVPISFIIGNPTQIRLVFLLFIAAACGFLFAYVRGLAREIKLKNEIRRLIGLHETTRASVSAAQNEDDFDEE